MNPDEELAFSAFVQQRGTHLLRYPRLLIPDDRGPCDAANSGSGTSGVTRRA